MGIFDKRPDRKTQAIATAATTVIATLATGGLGLLALGVGGLTWWVTGKATER